MTLANELLLMAPVDLERMADTMDTSLLFETIKELEGIAAKAAFVAGYLDERHGSGCGDQGHKKAVTVANRWRKKVRKAFGYDHTTAIRF